jgi:hypothetical protein
MTIVEGPEGIIVDEADEKPTSTLFDHCVSVYQEMEAQARDERNDGLVYEGHLTKLFHQLGLSTPYYTSVMNRLKLMGCVDQLRRGGGSSPSRWRLTRVPNEESFRSFENTNVAPKGKVAALEQELRILARRVTELERLSA